MYSAHRAAVQALASAELGAPCGSGVPVSAPSVRMRFICLLSAVVGAAQPPPDASALQCRGPGAASSAASLRTPTDVVALVRSNVAYSGSFVLRGVQSLYRTHQPQLPWLHLPVTLKNLHSGVAVHHCRQDAIVPLAAPPDPIMS